MGRAFCIVAFALSMALILPAGAAVGPGDPAPDFTLQDATGVSYTLSEQRGKVVLLAFVGYG